MCQAVSSLWVKSGHRYSIAAVCNVNAGLQFKYQPTRNRRCDRRMRNNFGCGAACRPSGPADAKTAFLQKFSSARLQCLVNNVSLNKSSFTGHQESGRARGNLAKLIQPVTTLSHRLNSSSGQERRAMSMVGSTRRNAHEQYT
jgi:hypothetical protein